MSINIIAPGVYSTVRDLSSFVDSQPSTTGFVPFFSERGPDNQLLKVSRSEFYALFGQPNVNYLKHAQYQYGPYIASSFLEESNNIYVMRCLPQDMDGTSATFSNLYLEVDGINAYLATDGTSGGREFELDSSSLFSKASWNTTEEIENEVNGSGSDILFAFYGVGRGEYYNNFQIDINPFPDDNFFDSDTGKGLYVIDIYKRQEFSRRFITVGMEGFNDSDVEYALVESYEVSFDPEARDVGGQSQFIEDVINNFSQNIKCIANKELLAEIVKRQDSDAGDLEININFSDAFIQSYDLENDLSYGKGVDMDGGDTKLFNSDGKLNTEISTLVLAAAYKGELKSSVTGDPIVDVNDVENTRFDVVFDAGYPADVKTEIVNLANRRRDIMAFIDLEDKSNATESVANRQTLAYNSPYAACYAPYSKLYDVFTGRDLWMPPTYHVSRIVAFSDRISELWYPVAGFKRATINGIKELRYNPSRANRETFTARQINPIVKFGIGYSVFGQRTLSTLTSARQDINVVRLVLFIQRSLEDFCKQYIFDINDEEVWGEVRDQVTQFLSEVKNRRGLYDFNVNVHASQFDIQRRRLNVDVVLEPIRGIEQIHLTFFIRG